MPRDIAPSEIKTAGDEPPRHIAYSSASDLALVL